VGVLGLSVDSITVLERFAAKHGLAFPLVTDQEREITRAYGVLKDNASLSAERATLVIGKDGVVVLAYPKVKAKGHAAQVLSDVRGARADGLL
jgi:peroxiredoxin Q/BCP